MVADVIENQSRPGCNHIAFWNQSVPCPGGCCQNL